VHAGTVSSNGGAFNNERPYDQHASLMVVNGGRVIEILDARGSTPCEHETAYWNGRPAPPDTTTPPQVRRRYNARRRSEPL
jgi:hypothetical protein